MKPFTLLLPFSMNLPNPSRKRTWSHLGWLNLLPNTCKLTSQGCSFRRLHFPCFFNVLALEENNKCLTHFISSFTLYKLEWCVYILLLPVSNKITCLVFFSSLNFTPRSFLILCLMMNHQSNLSVLVTNNLCK